MPKFAMPKFMPWEDVLRHWERAKQIKRTLGVRRAAGYLRNREFRLNQTLVALGFPVRYSNSQLGC